MTRPLAISLVALGTILFGIATGLVYIDDRALRIRKLELIEQQLKSPPPGPAASQPPTEPTPKIPSVGAPVIAAMAIGPLGAGLGLASPSNPPAHTPA